MIIWNSLSSDQKRAALQRPALTQSEELKRVVAAIVSEVVVKGDSALKNFTYQFDEVELDQIQVSEAEMESTLKQLSFSIRQAIDQAYTNIFKFHLKQLQEGYELETIPGVRCSLQIRPMESVGLYVPGGKTPLISTVLMLGVPAQIAGCPRTVLVSPPNNNGKLAPEIIYAASKCGIDTFFKVGGAQAISALAYGTETIPAVDKIFGPGNRYVTEAKLQVSQIPGLVGIDMPAGPSEVLVIADMDASPRFVAADLLSQAEHGPDSQVILVSDSDNLLQKVELEVQEQLKSLERQSIAMDSLKQSRFIRVDCVEDALDLSNNYAPEHLILNLDNARQYLPKITHAGSIFLGSWSPESAGDYASGTNHVLPTYGSARFTGSLTVQDFQKRSTVQEISREGLVELSKTILLLAQSEGLSAHAKAVSLRLEEFSK